MIRRLRKHNSLMWSYTLELARSFLRPVIIYLGFMSGTAVAAGSFLFYHLEKHSNPGMVSYLDAVYFTIATMTTVGYGDITPKTSEGKILAIFMMLAGISFFLCFTAALSASVLEIEERDRRGEITRK